MDSGCSNSMAFTGAYTEGLCVEGVCIASGGRCDRTTVRLSTVKVTKTRGHNMAAQRKLKNPVTQKYTIKLFICLEDLYIYL